MTVKEKLNLFITLAMDREYDLDKIKEFIKKKGLMHLLPHGNF